MHFSASAEKLVFPCCTRAITHPGREGLVLGLWFSISQLAALGRAAEFPIDAGKFGSTKPRKMGTAQAQHPGAGPGTPNRDEAGNHSDCNKLVIVFEEGRGLINYLWNKQINQA